MSKRDAKTGAVLAAALLGAAALAGGGGTVLAMPHAMCMAAMGNSMGMDPSGQGRRVRITYENLTSGQSFSPSAFVSHDAGAQPLFQMGQPASFGLMRIAEEGNAGPLLSDKVAKNEGDHFGTAITGISVMPGGQRSVDLEVTREHPMVSGGFMLVMTNDGFTGINGVNAYGLTRPMSMDLYAYDAGTERNNEREAYLVAMMGVERDPENGVVTRHAGIRGDADAPASWKFDPGRPVARLTITPLGAAPMAMGRR